MQYDLVFEGGGAKGMAFVGALQAFEAHGHTIGRLLGTSAGAITAALMAVGYDSQEMLAALGETASDGEPIFASFMGAPQDVSPDELTDSATRRLLRDLEIPGLPAALEDRLDDWIASALARHPRFRHVYSFIERGGWYSAHAFLTWLEGKLESGAFQGQPRRFGAVTLEALYRATGRHLSLVAADITAGRLLVLNHYTAPHCPLVWAVRMSMSIPLLWQEVVWRASWGAYRGEAIGGHRIVDGGLLSNFPLELLVSDAPYVMAVMGPKEAGHVLGLLIDESLPVEALDASIPYEAPIDLSELPTVQRLRGLVNALTQAHDKMVLEAFEDLVVRLPAESYGTTEFAMSATRREALVDAGRRAMEAHLAREEAVPTEAPLEADARATRAARQADELARRVLAR
ncbi:MAG: patatin-like phospholipase family protein [Anaerolineae bacterium]|nr:patatin-like phospholipase family protein [Anaerolineae bacterium]